MDKHRRLPITAQLGYVLLAILLGGYGVSSALADSGADDQVISKDITITAAIVKGCSIGTGGADVSNFGLLNFGSLANLDSAINIASSQGAGSVMIKCTPGISVTISIDRGVNSVAGISSGRLLKRNAGGETLVYQLYQDSYYQQVWGDGVNGGNSLTLSATGLRQELKIYGRLFATTTLPPAGEYSDTVMINITY